MGSWAWWRSWFLIFFGCSVMGAGFVLFVNPYNFVPGGVYGMGIVLHNIFPSIQVGTFGYMFDVPLMLVAMLVFGGQFGTRTVLAALYTPGFMNVLTRLVYPDAAAVESLDPSLLLGGRLDLSNDLLLTCVIGAVVIGVGQGIGIAQPTAFEFFRGSLDGRLHAAAIGNEPLVRLRMAEVLPESAIEVLHDSGYYQILFRGKYLVHRSNRDSAALCNLPYGNGGDAIFICNVVRGLDQVISIDLICSHERSRLLWGRNGRIVPIVLFFDAEGNERTFLPWRERCLGLQQLVAGTWSAFHSVGTQTDYGRFKRRMRLRWTASVFRDSTIFCNAALNVFLSSALFAK